MGGVGERVGEQAGEGCGDRQPPCNYIVTKQHKLGWGVWRCLGITQPPCGMLLLTRCLGSQPLDPVVSRLALPADSDCRCLTNPCSFIDIPDLISLSEEEEEELELSAQGRYDDALAPYLDH